MPVVFRCKRCGAILYLWHHHPSGIMQPTEFIRKVMPSCPFCLRRLEPPRGHMDIVIRPLSRKEQEELLCQLMREAVVLDLEKGLKVHVPRSPLFRTQRVALGASPSS